MSAISVAWTMHAEESARLMVAAMLSGQAGCDGGDCRLLDALLPGGGSFAAGTRLVPQLPEDVFDRQPACSADDAVCLIADVRLDNRAELAEALQISGADALADSAFLLAAWLCWGEEMVHHLLGAYAFAVWLPRERRVFAARDHTGERPLFFHQSTGLFALASMPKGILSIPGISPGFDEKRLIDCLILDQPDWSKSYYQGIERLPPGHLLRVRLADDGRDEMEVRPYWHPCDARPVRFRRDEEYAEALVEILDKATAARLRSTGGVASQLSAGLDSSTVTATAARLLAARGERLTAFTAVPRAGYHGLALPGRLAFEGPGAADVAAMYGNIDHVQLDSAGYDLLADIKAWTEAMDEPAQNCVNLLWIAAILKTARAGGARVMLQGVTGNATISADGWEAMTGYFRGGRWLELYRFATNMRRRGELSYKASLVLATNGLMPRWLKAKVKPGGIVPNLDDSPINPELVAEQNLLERAFQKIHGDLPDIRTQRARFFERFDHGPMNWAVESRFGLSHRDPLGDKRIFEFCFAVPIEQYAAGGQSRSLVRRAMRGRLPEATLARTVRGQQGVDWYLTVKEALPELREELRAVAQSALARRYLDVPRLERLANNWPESGHEGAAVTDSWNYALTRGVSIGYLLTGRTPEQMRSESLG